MLRDSREWKSARSLGTAVATLRHVAAGRVYTQEQIRSEFNVPTRDR